MHNLLTRVTPPPPRRLCVILLAAGLVIGAVLGPGILGQLAPEAYRSLWIGADAERAALQAHDDEAEEALARLQASGVSAVAISERREREAARRSGVQQALDAAEADRAALRERFRLGVTVAVMLAAGMTVLGLGRWTYPSLAAAVAVWTVLALGYPAGL